MGRYVAFPFLLISISVICLLLATLIDNKTCRAWKFDVKSFKLVRLGRWNSLFFGMKDVAKGVIIRPLAIKNILGYFFIINGIVLSIIYFIVPPVAEGLSNIEWAMIISLALNVFTLAFTNVFDPLSSQQKDEIEAREKDFYQNLDQLLLAIIELEEKKPITAKNPNCTYRPYHKVSIQFQSILLQIVIRYSDLDVLNLDCVVIDNEQKIALQEFLQKNNLKDYHLNGINMKEKIESLALVIEEILNFQNENVECQ